MTDKAKEAATRLYNRLNREDKKAVSTVGVGKSAYGGEVLLVFCRPDDTRIQIPESFDGFQVFRQSSGALKSTEMANA